MCRRLATVAHVLVAGKKKHVREMHIRKTRKKIPEHIRDETAIVMLCDYSCH